MSLARAEAGRILLAASRDLTADDRAYLVRPPSGVGTRLSPADAERRVGEVLDRSRQAIRKARQSNVMLRSSTHRRRLAAGRCRGLVRRMPGRTPPRRRHCAFVDVAASRATTLP